MLLVLMCELRHGRDKETLTGRGVAPIRCGGASGGGRRVGGARIRGLLRERGEGGLKVRLQREGKERHRERPVYLKEGLRRR